MNVKEIIDTMKTLGIGEVYNDEDSNRILLRFLNLANDELYSKTVNLNDDIYPKDIITSLPNQGSITLTRNPFFISNIWIEGFRGYLYGKSVDEFDDYQMQRNYIGNPDVYTFSGNTISFYPFLPETTYTFNIRYKPQRQKLELTTQESEIPYPISFHYVLVKGALRYLFQDEAGFKNTARENDAKVEWEKGIVDMVAFFASRNRQSVSTYNEI